MRRREGDDGGRNEMTEGGDTRREEIRGEGRR